MVSLPYLSLQKVVQSKPPLDFLSFGPVQRSNSKLKRKSRFSGQAASRLMQFRVFFGVSVGYPPYMGGQ